MAARESTKAILKRLGLSKDQRSFVDALPSNVEYSIAAGGTGVSEITLTVKDGEGNAVGPTQLILHLSDAATGLGVTATTASGTVDAKASSGTTLAALTAKKVLIIQTKADGTYVLSITDTAKTGFYVAAQLPNGKLDVSRQLVTADYGA